MKSFLFLSLEIKRERRVRDDYGTNDQSVILVFISSLLFFFFLFLSKFFFLNCDQMSARYDHKKNYISFT